MDIFIKKFEEFSNIELYNLLQLRNEIFVVEQECAYQDIDGKDFLALHIIGYKKNELVSYARCFPPGTYFSEASIGRVLVKESFRGTNCGQSILKASIKAISTHYNTETIKISAQTYLRKFYESFGFKQEGREYLEDGIPHISMTKG
jgi:ElaA protein